MTTENRDATSLEKNEMAFAAELARGASIAQSAKKVGISLSSGHRWARKAEVRQTVQEIRSSVLQCATSQIINLTSKAVETLDKLLASKNEQIQLSAARTIIDGAVKLKELAEMQQELENIRAIVVTIQEHPQLRRNHA